MAKQKIITFRERLINELRSHFTITEFESQKETIISKGSQKAINSYDNDQEEVYATCWFDSYCFFIRIQLKKDDVNQDNGESKISDKIYKDLFKPFVSVSFFQDIDGNLKQLFRAEWDSFVTEGYNHPQPHWHFTAQLSDKTSFSDLQDAKEESDFSKLAGNSKTLNIDRMHFAMGGSWYEDGNMLCETGDEKNLVNWLNNLFKLVSEELTYKDRKKE